MIDQDELDQMASQVVIEILSHAVELGDVRDRIYCKIPQHVTDQDFDESVNYVRNKVDSLLRELAKSVI